MLTRPVHHRHYSAHNVIPVPTPDSHETGQLLRSSGGGMHLPRGGDPMTDMGNGILMPAAQDPTDPRTWRTPVRFT